MRSLRIQPSASVFWGMLIVILAQPVSADELLKNPNFREWKDGRPVGWKVSFGAGRRAGRESTLLPGKPDGIVLQGDRGTRRWRFVNQVVPAKPGACYRLRFRVRASGVKREAGQFNNCYVGFFFRAADSKPVGHALLHFSDTNWSPQENIATTTKGAVTAEVGLFLSKTGRLHVTGLSLEELKPADSYDVLVQHMDRYYSYFALRKIDWKALAAKHRAAAMKAKSPEEFAAAIKSLLAELKDIHVWIDLPNGKRIAPYVNRVDGNYDFRAVRKTLKDVKQIGRIALTGRTAEGYGYVAIGSLAGPEKPFRELESAIDGLLDAKGMLIDLRSNAGGSEPRAQRIAAMFADKRRMYAQSKVRTGPKHTDFSPPSRRFIQPRSGKSFTKPVVCLIGPRCVSSGEGFALMLKALPHVRLVGLPTRGASGNPAPVRLPNGVQVYFSRWVALQADGKPFEGTGIAPDVKIAHSGDGDPTFERAVKELTERIKSSRRVR